MINIALPKGRMGDKAYNMFSAAGYSCACYDAKSRKLVFVDDENGISFLLIKPQDVAVYVERGVADIGVVGKDVLLEKTPDVFELLDLKFGACRLMTAAPVGFKDNPGRVLRVATKYANVAREYYASQNRDIDIIKLNGSIELAPLLNLSDIIVDVVETGTTLRENRLETYDLISRSSARLIANKSAYKFKRESLSEMISALSAVLNDGGAGILTE